MQATRLLTEAIKSPEECTKLHRRIQTTKLSNDKKILNTLLGKLDAQIKQGEKSENKLFKMFETENISLHQLRHKQTFANWRAQHSFPIRSCRLTSTFSGSLQRDHTHPMGQTTTKNSKAQSDNSDPLIWLRENTFSSLLNVDSPQPPTPTLTAAEAEKEISFHPSNNPSEDKQISIPVPRKPHPSPGKNIQCDL